MVSRRCKPLTRIEHAVVEVGLRYFAAPSRQGGRRQPTLTSSTLALVRQKQQLAREMARRRHETWSPLETQALRANYDGAAKQARTAVKKDKISNLESLARTAEEAHKDRDPRTVYQVIRRLAPAARLPTRTVRCIATGVGTNNTRWKKSRKLCVRSTKERVDHLSGRPLAPPRRRRCAPDVAELSRAIKRLPNFKAAQKIFLGDPLADTSTAMTRGSVAEVYKLGVDSLAPALAGCRRVRVRMLLRTIATSRYRGKALVGAQLKPLMRTLQSNLDACQFGAVVRRSTRDAIALADEILRRYRLHRRRQRPARRARAGQQPSQPCLAMTLFDLSKAFDLLVRTHAWKAVGRLAQDASIECFLEELHRGVCYILKDKHTGQLRKRILTDMGGRQGSVEGPTCFLALYDIATWEIKTAGDRTAITAQQQGISTEVGFLF